MRLEAISVVRLRTDLPKQGLFQGERGTIVHVYDPPGGYEVEFVAPDGTTRVLGGLADDQVDLVWLAGPCAEFPECRRSPGEMLPAVVQAVEARGWTLCEGSMLYELRAKPGSWSYRDGQAVAISRWEEAVPFSDRWDGLRLHFGTVFPFQLELGGRPAPFLSLTETFAAYDRQKVRADEATRWASLLIDLLTAAMASECSFPAGVTDPDLFVGHRAPAGHGYREIALTWGATLFTRLPVKASPFDNPRSL